MRRGIFYGPEMKINFNQRGENTMTLSPLEAGKKIDALIKKYRFEHPEVDYKVAMKRVLEVNPKLKELYSRTQVTMPPDAAEFSATDSIYSNPADDPALNSEAVRLKVDNRIKMYQAAHPEMDYAKAMDTVFSLDPELKKAYARS